MGRTIQPPGDLQAEGETLGRSKVAWLRMAARQMRSFEMDEEAIRAQLIRRGCSTAFANWLIDQIPPEASDLAKEFQASPSSTTDLILRILLLGAFDFLLGVIAFVMERTQSYTAAVLLAPVLMFFGFFTTLALAAAVVKLVRRLGR